MQKVTENWSKTCQCFSKPMADLMDLNIKSLNKMAENTKHVQDAIQGKKPEDLVSAQINLVSGGISAMADYSRKALEILLNGAGEIGKVWSDSLRDSVSAARQTGEKMQK